MVGQNQGVIQDKISGESSREPHTGDNQMKQIRIEEGAYINPEYIVAITDNTLTNQTSVRKTTISMLNGLTVESKLPIKDILDLCIPKVGRKPKDK